MKGKELKKRMKRLCALVLAGMLALPTLPVLADDDPVEETKVINAADLRPGDILQPGTVVKNPEDQFYVLINYYDYDEKEYWNNVVYTYIDNGNQSEILSYTNYNPDGQRNLAEDEFAGWQVVDADCYYNGCTGSFYVYLRALPKTEQEMTVTIHSALKTEENLTSETATENDQQPAEEPSVNLIGFDSKTGKYIKEDENGNLTAKPGDVIFAYTTAVAGSYSELDIYAGSGKNSIGNKFYYWDEGIDYEEKTYLNYETDYPMEPIRYEFLPEDTDALSYFVVPYTDVTVEAFYYETDVMQTVTYLSDDPHKIEGEPTVFESKEVPVNSMYTVWNPENNQKTGGKDVLYWSGYSGHGSDEVYNPGEKIRIKNGLSMIGNYVQDKTFSIDCESGIKIYYYSVADAYSENQKEAARTDDQEALLVVLDPENTAGQSAIGFSVKNDNGTKDVLFETGLKAGLAADVDMHTYRFNSFFNASSTVSLIYSDQTPEDVLVDLSKEDSLLQMPGETDEMTWTIYGTVCEKNAAYKRTDAMDLMDYNCWLLQSQRYVYPGHTKGVTRKTLLDLNKDGAYDVAARIHAYSGELTWTKLAGADACKEGSYVINMNRGGYGKLTIKVGEKKEDPKVDPDPKPQPDDKQGGKQTADPKTGEKKVPAAGTEIKDSATGNTYIVTKAASGTDKNAAGEVKVKSVVLKKGTAVIPDAVVIDGITYKVTAVDKNVLKGAAKAKSLEVGENITKLPAGLIKGAKKVKSIKIRNTKKVITLNKKFFAGRKGKIKLLVPKKLFKKYQAMVKKKKIGKFVTLKKY